MNAIFNRDSIFNKESLLLVMILFVPSVNFGIYYVAIFFLSAFIIFTRRQVSYFKKEWLYILLTIFVFYLLVISIRSFAYISVSDYKEIVKLALFIVVLMSFKNIKISDIEKIFVAYISLSFIVSVSQFMHINNAIIDLFSSIYADPNHLSVSLSQNSVRSIGLSTDPGASGTLSLLFYVFFLTLLLFDKLTKLRYIGAAASLVVLFLSQSKSSLIALILVSVFICLLVIFNTKRYTTNRLSLIVILLLFGLVLYWVFKDILSYFYGYSKLLNAGLNVSSMGARVEKWIEFYEAIVNENNILMLLFGAGRGFLDANGIKSSVFDNDYVYLFVNYGFIGLLLFSTCMFSAILGYLIRFNHTSISDKILLFIFFAGCIASFAISFYINVKIIGLIALFLSLAFFTKRSLRI